MLRTATEESAIFDELLRLAREAAPLTDPVVIREFRYIGSAAKDGRNTLSFLSGHPYMWSGYPERAFVMNRADAKALLEKFPDALAEAEMHDRPDQRAQVRIHAK